MAEHEGPQPPEASSETSHDSEQTPERRERASAEKIGKLLGRLEELLAQSEEEYVGQGHEHQMALGYFRSKDGKVFYDIARPGMLTKPFPQTLVMQLDKETLDQVYPNTQSYAFLRYLITRQGTGLAIEKIGLVGDMGATEQVVDPGAFADAQARGDTLVTAGEVDGLMSRLEDVAPVWKGELPHERS
jgi:hypothetical protein